MSKILIPSSGPDDWQQFLADPQKQWKRGYSAMAAALSWEAAQGLPPEVAAMLDPDAKLLFAITGNREITCLMQDWLGLSPFAQEDRMAAVEDIGAG